MRPKDPPTSTGFPVNDAVTLKRFYVERNRVRLKAENPKYPPIFTQNVRILGKLAFLMRSYA